MHGMKYAWGTHILTTQSTFINTNFVWEKASTSVLCGREHIWPLEPDGAQFFFFFDDYNHANRLSQVHTFFFL